MYFFYILDFLPSPMYEFGLVFLEFWQLNQILVHDIQELSLNNNSSP